MGMTRNAWTCPKCANIRHFQYFSIGWSYCFDFMHVTKIQPSQSGSYIYCGVHSCFTCYLWFLCCFCVGSVLHTVNYRCLHHYDSVEENGFHWYGFLLINSCWIRGWWISKFIQLRQVISDDSLPEMDNKLARLNKFDINLPLLRLNTVLSSCS